MRPLQLSGLTFLLPCALALSTGRPLACAASGALAITSFLFHADKDAARVPRWVRVVDPLLAKACVLGYTAACLAGWRRGGGGSALYLAGALGGAASACVYGIELLLLGATVGPAVVTRAHVACHQLGMLAWLCYLRAAAQALQTPPS